MNYSNSHLATKAAAELELRRRKRLGLALLDDYDSWLTAVFPDHFSTALGTHHHQFWQWASSITADTKPEPLVAVFARGGGKSTNTEVLPIYLHLRGVRSYCWYISDTQAQADDHVANIAAILESLGVERKLNKYGNSRGWRRNRVWTESGLVIDAMGLDTARRGVRLEERRPDLMVLDDIDSEDDTVDTVDKNERTIQTKLLPAGTNNTAVVICQNLVIKHGIVSRLVTGKATWLYGRTVIGPIPAVEGLVTEQVDGRDVIVGGVATWEGQSLDICQSYIDEWGLSAFKREAQHEVDNAEDAIYVPMWWNGRNRHSNNYTGIARYILADTGYKDKQQNDPTAIGVFDLTADYKLALVRMYEQRMLSADIPDRIYAVAMEHGGENEISAVVIEDKGSGITAVQTLQASYPRWLSSIVYPFNVGQLSKTYRAKLASIWCTRNRVLLPEMTADNMHWMSKFADPDMGQLFLFPNVSHDDMTDVFTMAILFTEPYLLKAWQMLNKSKPVYKDNRVRAALQRAGQL